MTHEDAMRERAQELRGAAEAEEAHARTLCARAEELAQDLQHTDRAFWLGFWLYVAVAGAAWLLVLGLWAFHGGELDPGARGATLPEHEGSPPSTLAD